MPKFLNMRDKINTRLLPWVYLRRPWQSSVTVWRAEPWWLSDTLPTVGHVSDNHQGSARQTVTELCQGRCRYTQGKTRVLCRQPNQESFRLWVTCQTTTKVLPVRLLQNSVKAVVDTPKVRDVYCAGSLTRRASDCGSRVRQPPRFCQSGCYRTRSRPS